MSQELKNNIITSLKSYMLTDDAMQCIASLSQCVSDFPKDESENKKLPLKISQTKPENLWIPQYRDKLFWCIYYIINGEHAYMEAGKHAFRVEKDTKISIMENLHKISTELKEYGIKVSELAEDLVMNKCMTYKGLIAICLVNSIRILYVKNRTYLEIGNSDNISGLIVIKEHLIGLRKDQMDNLTPTENEIEDIRNSLFHITKPNKPIRALSAYSLTELIDITGRLNIQVKDANGKTKIKKILYEDILTQL